MRGRSWHGQTALMWAAAQGHPDDDARAHRARRRRQRALERRANGSGRSTAEPRDKWLPPGGLTPLLFAAREGCARLRDRCSSKPAPISTPSIPDGISALILALINGHYDVGRRAASKGHRPQHADKTGRGRSTRRSTSTPCQRRTGPPPSVIEQQADGLDVVRRCCSTAAPIRMRGWRSNRRIAPSWIAATTRCSERGTTPFFRAAKAGDLPAMRLLLEHGADPKLGPTRSGITPLMAAAGLGTKEEDTTGRYKTQAQAIEAIQLLLDRGADVNARRPTAARRYTARACRATTTSSGTSPRTARICRRKTRRVSRASTLRSAARAGSVSRAAKAWFVRAPRRSCAS